ncbi:MAG: hypothetical protein NTY83_03990, partial [Candidatus Micrarchaeota archaeon]|nr:hypothetical protein [Candidatus Micrarchaeota archaeon]
GRAAVSAAPAVSQIPVEIMDRHSMVFNAEEIIDMWENLQRGIFVTPRAGTEVQAKLLYEDFIRTAARESPTGEVSGILIRGDMSGVNIGNQMLGTDVMDRTIMVRMRGVRETVMDTAERLGLEGVTPVFTRRPGRSDEFMVAIFGPGDSVTAHADEFIAALRDAPSGRITDLTRAQRFGEGSLSEIAAAGLDHPESITKFKFDYADFSVTSSAPAGFLDEAVGRAVNSGSAAHTPVVADVLGMGRTDLLFVPNRSITQMQPGQIVNGSVLDIAFRMPPSVQQAVEGDMGGFLLPRLDGMAERRFITPAERDALAQSISMHDGSLPIDDAARYLFRKGTGQALSGEERIKLLNSLVGEERFNPFATVVDDAVARYAREHGIAIERASGSPTMQYSIKNVSGAEAAMHQEGIQAAVYDALSQEGVQLIPSVRMFDAPSGLTAGSIDLFLGAQRSGGVRAATSTAGDFVVTNFGSGPGDFVEYIFHLVPPQSRAAMEEVLETIGSGRGITKLNDLYEVLQRTDPALYENFIRILERPEFLEGLVRIMPAESGANLGYLATMPF